MHCENQYTQKIGKILNVEINLCKEIKRKFNYYTKTFCSVVNQMFELFGDTWYIFFSVQTMMQTMISLNTHVSPIRHGRAMMPPTKKMFLTTVLKRLRGGS